MADDTLHKQFPPYVPAAGEEYMSEKQLAHFREILGSGTWFGMRIVPQSFYDAGFVNNGLMVLAPGAFLLLGIIVWVQRSLSGYSEKN